MDNPIYNGSMLIVTFIFCLLQFYAIDATDNLTFMAGYLVPTVVISSIFLIDMIINFSTRSFKNIRKKRPVIFFEIFLSISYWISFIIDASMNLDYTKTAQYSTTNTIFWMRLLRCFEFMMELHDYRLLVVTTKNLTKPFMYKALLLYMVFFCFSALGQKLWGGIIDR